MNIREAKEQIKGAMTAYFERDELGQYGIPRAGQRPVFLMGPPGIGKTAVMEQVAEELGVALVSYSMTHHTRQSAIGLPYIERKSYGGVEYAVSEYTMSEIIASVYDTMEETGKREGILFLDEINCVSETLAPAMLQFLQYKTFGKHRVPDGWIVVTAGNPPEYNASVREFDVATWDRLKRIDVEPDFDCWKEHALATATHPAIIAYLDARRDHFYKIETTVDGKTFVTARGWSDLSAMIRMYERKGLSVDARLVSQYIQNPQIAKAFASYYALFVKYRASYSADEIFSGTPSSALLTRAKDAKFDERIALVRILLDAAVGKTREIACTENMLGTVMHALRDAREAMTALGRPAAELAAAEEEQLSRTLASEHETLSYDRGRELLLERAFYRELIVALDERRPSGAAEAFAVMKECFDARVAAFKSDAAATRDALDHAFAFLESVWGSESREILVYDTEMTASESTARFIGKYGCTKYFEHNKALLFYERQRSILAELEALGFEI